MLKYVAVIVFVLLVSGCNFTVVSTWQWGNDQQELSLEAGVGGIDNSGVLSGTPLPDSSVPVSEEPSPEPEPIVEPESTPEPVDSQPEEAMGTSAVKSLALLGQWASW